MDARGGGVTSACHPHALGGTHQAGDAEGDTKRMTAQKKTIAEAVADSEPWDFDSWLDDGARPQRHATLYAKNNLQADIVELERQLEEHHPADADLYDDTARLAALEEQLQGVVDSDRMVGGVDSLRSEISALKAKIEKRSKTSVATKLQRKIEELQHQIAASGKRFTLQAMTEDEQKQIDDRYPLPRRPAPVKTGDELSDMETNAARDDEHTEAMAEVYRKRYFEYMALQIIEPRKFTVDELKKIQATLGEAEFTKLFTAGQEASAAMSASTPTWRGNLGGRQDS